MSDTPVNYIHYLWGITAMAVGCSIVYKLIQREKFSEEVRRAGLYDINVVKTEYREKN